jgi:hypothetical protein
MDAINAINPINAIYTTITKTVTVAATNITLITYWLLADLKELLS